MKNTVTLAWDGRAVLSPHIGELDTPRSNDIFERIISDIQDLYDVKSTIIAHDFHPGYASSRWARRRALPAVSVLHHHAHASALAGEHPDVSRWLVFTWDGVGLGEDGELWGGEALLGSPGKWRRVASFRSFGLVGGDKAGREPWRSAAAMMWETGIDWNTGVAGSGLALSAWRSGLGVHRTSAAGRLFDAAAALVLDRKIASFEGQGPMELEALAHRDGAPVTLPLARDADGLLRSDWSPLLKVLSDEAIPPAERASIFHASMAGALVSQALRLRDSHPFDAVGLSGGVFQNRCLCELAVDGLASHGIEARMHRKVPANDGGLSYGQAVEAAARLARSD